MVYHYLSDSNPLLLKDDSEVLFHPLRVEVFCSTGLQLKGELLEIFEPSSEKHSVGCIHCLDPVLTKRSKFDLF